MRNISRWARRNPWPARILIVLIKITLILLAWFISRSLLELNIVLPSPIGYTALAIALAACFAYPSKRRVNTSRLFLYRWQKTCDIILGATCFLLALVFFNNNFFLQNHYLQASHSTLPPSKDKPSAQAILESLKHRDNKSLTRTEKRILKKEFKLQVKAYVRARLQGDENKAGRIAASILAIIAAVGLIALLGALACEISCAGSEVLALIVFIVGTAAIIYGTWWLLGRINRRKAVRDPAAKAMVN